MIITIDGPSGTGKSTTARCLAQRLGFAFFDTGALYRSFAYFSHVLQGRDVFSWRVQERDGGKHYIVCGIDVTNDIRSPEITALASQLAALPEVRALLLPFQRDYAKIHDTVFEGRDVGTVVFPEAEIKIFLTATPHVRAERRHREMRAKQINPPPSVEEILDALQQRDQADSTRNVAPLACPKEAFVLDTSFLVQEEVVDILEQYCHQKIKERVCRDG